MYKYLLPLVTFFLFGCANHTNVPPPVYKDPSIPNAKTLFHIPELGSKSTAEVGENLYTKFYYTPANTYEVSIQNDIVLSESKDRQYAWLLLGVLGAGVMELSADKNQELLNKDNKKLLSYWPEYGYKMMCGSENTCLVDKGSNGFFSYKVEYPKNKLDDLPAKVPYKLTQTQPKYDQDDFKYMALYQGKADNKIKISFREFVNDMARPAFTQDIEYELDQDGQTIIGFKGLRIMVHKATNLNIEYTVLHDYN
ncbi:hypothetical protein OAP63_10495 [Vibrio sp.]|nr:hypothetical protein [Vibrio sp.]